jgi:hypothetical protein
MQPLPIMLAAALRARRKSEPGGRLATLSYRHGEEQAQPKYGGGLWVPAASGAALAPADRRAGARPVAWSSSCRSGVSAILRCVC